jgi:hypothetical protein
MINANPNSKLKVNSGSKESKEIKYESLSLDTEENTKIYAGHGAYTVKQLQQEMDSNSEIGRKLKQVEDKLKDY